MVPGWPLIVATISIYKFSNQHLLYVKLIQPRALLNRCVKKRLHFAVRQASEKQRFGIRLPLMQKVRPWEGQAAWTYS